MAEQNLDRFYKNPYLFNAKELDRETGLYYYGARYYNPKLSIWYGVDPLAEKMPSWSPYTYTFDNPVKFTDPTGMEGEDWYEDEDGNIKWFDSAESNLTDNNGTKWNHFSDGKTNNTYTAKNGAFVTLGSGGASDWTADYTDVNRDRLYSAIANCEVCQQIEKGEQFLFIDVPMALATGGLSAEFTLGALGTKAGLSITSQMIAKQDVNLVQLGADTFFNPIAGSLIGNSAEYNFSDIYNKRFGEFNITPAKDYATQVGLDLLFIGRNKVYNKLGVKDKLGKTVIEVQSSIMSMGVARGINEKIQENGK